MPKVSVIIPVYNAAAYIEECVASVLGQSLDDLEVICVNDGSSDDSGALLADLALRDARVSVIEQRNLGPSAARNAGVAAALGEYLCFVDGDDRLAPGALDRLYERATADALDVVFFSAAPFFESEELAEAHAGYLTYYTPKGVYPGVMSGPELMVMMDANGDYRPSVVLQFIRAAFYRATGLGFFEGIIHEDNLFTFVCTLKAKRVVLDPDEHYERRVRERSIMTSEKTAAHFRGYLTCHVEMLRFLMESDLDPATSTAAANRCVLMHTHALRTLSVLPDSELRALDGGSWRAEYAVALGLLREAAARQSSAGRLEADLKLARRKLSQSPRARIRRAVKRAKGILRPPAEKD